ncbi:MAG: type II toxin-antitoxin system VapC family toxin [Hydrococcus sp. RU_2_2]|nr:type II toxin-antitoxin system VapC family toxin [Hydrococcus sp. RU_2_2]NJP21512.1 type II toxin-antitoxin system VapC family toxin [Hydrococcus sp. CRU_1_1]
MTITFIDSGVLVTAVRGEEELAQKAFAILEDSEREFASSLFIKLEVLPKAIYNRQTEEAKFYETFFNAVTHWALDLEKLLQDAYQIAYQYGLAAMDALHIAAALSVGAEEFLTTEKSTKPMYRVTNIRIVSIFD